MSGQVGVGGRRPVGHPIATRDIDVDSFECLRAATPSSQAEIVQTEAGRMQGRLKHATIAGLSLGFGTFSRGVVSRGIYSNERVTIGFLFKSKTDRLGAGPLAMVRIWCPGAEHERNHKGGASFGAVSVSLDDIARCFGPDSRLSDIEFWRRKSSFVADHRNGSAGASALRGIMSSFEGRAHRISEAHASFWKRAILDAVTGAVMLTEPPERYVRSPVRLVRSAQDYVDASGPVPVHISELLSALRVSRRSLHRAFDEVLGIPPMTYLRYKRLCAARIRLREGTTPGLTVADVAFEHGFSDPSRFAAYYRSLFGENPSDTISSSC